MPLLADLCHAVRLLARSPLFAATAVVSLSLGVAASSAIYNVADALLAPAVGVRDPAQVVDIGRADDGAGFDNMSHPAYEYLRRHATTLALAGIEFGGRPMSLTVGGVSERVFGTLVSANVFDVLGTRPALGRFFQADEDAVPGERPVVVLTHRFWTRRLGADPHVLDRPLRLNNREFAVVGVAEPGFEGPTLAGTDVFVPMVMVAEARGLHTASILTEVRGVWHVGVGRLAPGATLAGARAELNTLMAQYRAATPAANPRHTIALVPTSRVPGPMRTPFLAFLGVLFALTGALLAIASSNVAGMLLARGAARQREMATRLAIGASRGRLVRQLLTETAVLFAGAAVVAAPLTLLCVRLLNASLPALPVSLNLAVAVNGRVAAFAAGLSLVTGLVFGLAPARHALRTDVAPLLHGGSATPDRRRWRLRHALVVAQVALSLMLIVTAGLFVRTLQNAAQASPGFSTTDIVLANVDVSLSGFRDASAVDLVERFRTRVAGLPGVVSVAASRMIPLQGSGFGLGALHVPGYVNAGGTDDLETDWNVVSPEYFDTLGMRLVEGRAFRGTDRNGGPVVAIVNETFARTAWPGRPALGQRIFHEDRDDHRVPVEVVGVAADAKYRYFNEGPRPFIYVALAQHPLGDVTLFVKHAPGRSPASDLRAALAQVEASVPAMFVQSFDEAVAVGLTPQRLTAWIAGSVGALGVGLAALGLYGLMAFVVTQRTRELAIRMALGATRADVRRLVLRLAVRLGLLGAVLGLALAAGVGRMLASLLVGVGVVDLVSYGGAVGLLLAVLAAAAWAPAHRAAATDPAASLRAE